MVTENLVDLILRQEQNLENYDSNTVKTRVTKTKADKEQRLKEEYNDILSLVDEGFKRNLELATEKGAGAWLTALPLQDCGYVLNKQEFRDSICLRYGWRIPNTPSHCSCNKSKSL